MRIVITLLLTLLTVTQLHLKQSVVISVCSVNMSVFCQTVFCFNTPPRMPVGCEAVLHSQTCKQNHESWRKQTSATPRLPPTPRVAVRCAPPRCSQLLLTHECVKEDRSLRRSMGETRALPTPRRLPLWTCRRAGLDADSVEMWEVTLEVAADHWTVLGLERFSPPKACVPLSNRTVPRRE